VQNFFEKYASLEVSHGPQNLGCFQNFDFIQH